VLDQLAQGNFLSAENIRDWAVNSSVQARGFMLLKIIQGEGLFTIIGNKRRKTSKSVL
jgi:hypothetical protein